MEDLLMRSLWLLILAIVAFAAVSCDRPSSPPLLIVATQTPEQAPTAQPRQAPTSSAVVERTPAALLALNPQPAPQSGQVQISGKGFVPGESIRISSARTADANAARLPLANTTAGADGSFDRATLTLPDE